MPNQIHPRKTKVEKRQDSDSPGSGQDGATQEGNGKLQGGEQGD